VKSEWISESGKGSTFWFTFRAETVTDDQEEKSVQVEEDKQQRQAKN
jgi:hypothetical protein